MIQKLKKKTIWIPLLIILIAVSSAVIKFSGDDDQISVISERVKKRDIVHKINASDYTTRGGSSNHFYGLRMDNRYYGFRR